MDKMLTIETAREMLENIPEEERTCLLMFHIEGLSIKEIAETLHITEETVKFRLNSARKNIEEQGK